MVTINPYNPQEVVAVWIVDVAPLGESFAQGAFTIDGGGTWSALPGTAANPSGIGEFINLQASDPGVAFDSQGNVFVLDSQHDTVTPKTTPIPASGSLLLSSFSFSGAGANATLTANFIDNPVYQWTDSTIDDAVLNPVLAVDPGTYPNSTPASNPPAAGIPKDPFANNVYIAWASNDIPDPQVNYTGLFNPNRIDLIVSSDGGQTFSGITPVNTGGATSVTLSGGLSYINPDDANNADLDTSSPQDNAHPQLVVDSATGQITVGWNNLETGAMQSNTVQAGISQAATQLTTSIGNFFGPLIPDPRGNWVTTNYAAGPSGVNENPVSIALGDVNGDKEADIVVADNNAGGGIGVLLNGTTAGTFPANATVYPAGTSTDYVSLGTLVNPPPSTVLDAVVANGTGGVNILPNPATGVFSTTKPFATGLGTDAVGSGNFDGTANEIVAVNTLSNTVTITDPLTGKILKTLNSGLDAPTALAVGDFNGDGLPDIAVFNSGNDTLRIFLNREHWSRRLRLPGGDAVHQRIEFSCERGRHDRGQCHRRRLARPGSRDQPGQQQHQRRVGAAEPVDSWPRRGFVRGLPGRRLRYRRHSRRRGNRPLEHVGHGDDARYRRALQRDRQQHARCREREHGRRLPKPRHESHFPGPRLRIPANRGSRRNRGSGRR